MKKLITILGIMSFAVSDAQVFDTAVFQINGFLKTTRCLPYPSLRSVINNIDTSGFVNVMNYGAFGDGVHIEDAAIVAAINAAPAGQGVIFPSGKTFLSTAFNSVNINKDITFYAYGATIKKTNNSRYSFLSLTDSAKQVIWLGGTLDGNKDNQSWPGSPTGDTTWEEDHGQILRILKADCGIVKDLRITNSVVDGVTFSSCKIAIFSNCTADNGAPLTYGQTGDQGTYFKVRQTGAAGEQGTSFYCLNLNITGGSIGIHYSTNFVEDSSITVIKNCSIYNVAQDAIHLEHCRRTFVYNTSITKDTTTKIFDGNRVRRYSGDVHISSDTKSISFMKCTFRNSKLDFRIGSNLKLGIVNMSTFTKEDDSTVFIDTDHATHVVNSTFDGKCGTGQLTQIFNARKCTFMNFGDHKAIGAGKVIDSCTFINGTISPINFSSGGVVHGSTFTSCPANTQVSSLTDPQLAVFNSSILILDNNGKRLGTIFCK